ncbi:MAG: hypothetical protein BMS9Abin10_0213 [Gammaproteobacteria bacterium]|nr:MAG: hypothetical protein BMS9Abin10_0213 [Gammaproteobacteria bacterium]
MRLSSFNWQMASFVPPPRHSHFAGEVPTTPYKASLGPRAAAVFAAADPGERFFGYFLVATRKDVVRRDETRLIYESSAGDTN